MTACEEANYALSLGIDLIISDHHLAGERIPQARAVVNPKFEMEKYPGGELAGVGVVFKIAQALYRRLSLDESELEEHLDLVALGTAADVVPVTKENRILCKFGLEQIAKSNKPGLKALIIKAGLQGKQIGTSQVVFGLAPRLNAVGRLGDAIHSMRLLVTKDESEACQIAQFLDTENQRRRSLDERTQKEALDMVTASVNLEKEKAIVMASNDWHQGILGIVAARLAENFYRPTILVTFDQEEGKGSGRSIPGFDLFAALRECRDYLVSFGGHRQAAGMNITRDRFDEFKKKFLAVSEEKLSENDLIPRQHIDAELSLDEIDEKLVESIELLAPFGPGNMRPVFATNKLFRADFPGIVGNNHLKLRVSQEKAEYDAIGFSLGEWAKPIATHNGTFDLAYVLENNIWNGRSRIQLRIKDVKLSN
jgi:single-stranded-DNA-specific exonuclease